MFARLFSLPGLLCIFVALGVVYSTITPIFEVSDEVWHYPMVKTLADGNGLPVQNPAQPGPWRQEGSQPPLYYALMAAATFWIDTGDMEHIRWINPHTDNGLITPDRNNNILIHTDRELWPWTGTVLAVRLIRLLSVLLGAGTVFFTHRLALALMPERHDFALASAAFVAFTPMFLFISASVNNDNLAIFSSAGVLWLLARWLRRPPLTLGWPHLGLGLLLGCGALSKQSALGLLPIAGLVLLVARLLQWEEGRRRQDVKLKFGVWTLAVEILAVFGLATLLAFWWYWRNYQLYGDWLGWNAFLATVGQRPQPASLAQLWGERVGFMQAYWGLFGGVSVPMPAWTYTVLNTIVALAGVGLLIGIAHFIFQRNFAFTTFRPLIPWALPILWWTLIVVGLVRWTSLTWASQGRLIFPALSAIAVLTVAGLAQLAFYVSRLTARLPTSFLIPPLLFMGLLSAAVPFTVIAPHYQPPPTLTAAQLEAIPNRVNVDFGGEMTLLGYGLDTTQVQPGDAIRLTLYWQTQIAMDRNWSIFVHLVDSDGIIAAQRDRYPGQGLLATTLLQPGQTFADEYVIPVPDTAYAPISAQLVVGLYDLTDGARLFATPGTEALSLAALNINTKPTSHNFGNLIALTRYDIDKRVLKPGETLQLTLYWQALRPIATNYAVFTHVRGEGETLWAGKDAWPQNGNAPTALWQPAQTITDTYDLTLKLGTPPGQYPIEIGLYHSETLERLQVITADGRISDADFIFLSKIRVEP